MLTIPRPVWNFADVVDDVNYFFANIAPIDTSEHWRFHTVGFSGGVSRQPGGYRIHIIDLNGRVIRDVSNVKGGLYQADVSTLSKGMYILQIQHGETKEQRKFIRE
ncbi:T9SS type A sorting domain-containing protein [Chitinophaga horti]|uniref:T9SS type A sorting domain-containing protein n=1 Tax=Chitinophaga horti TaxID=2920382 RepID=A0ABY6J632_9BACT|nr:T9SS type A sorting domain-containing protein [Chitinophaga horti]UYQ95145.1 T9SS type A sorting domain-containing protein [Chitinophaga horti]